MITSRPWKNFAKGMTFYLPHNLRGLVYRGLKKGSLEDFDVTNIRNVYLQHGAIFFHIPKTGGISINTRLYDAPIAAHLGIVAALRIFTADEFRQAFKFAFVRNPFDRLVSAFFHLKRSAATNYPPDTEFFARYGDITKDGFSAFVDWVSQKDACYRHAILIPQHEFICLGDRIMVDVLGRFETIAQDYSKIASRIGLNESLPRINETEHEHYSKYYDDRLADSVLRIYKRDFEIFGYNQN